MDQTRNRQLAEDLLRRFGAALRGIQLYSGQHPLVTRNIESLAEILQIMHAHGPSVTIGAVGEELIVDDMPLLKASVSMSELIRRLQAIGAERITFDRGVTTEELAAFVQEIGRPRTAGDAAPEGEGADPLASAHIRTGRVRIERKVEGSAADSATIRRLYAEAASVASAVWEGARTDGRPQPEAARSMIEGLAQAVSQNRTALLALTALKDYDNYTFTHMVNVSILTMAQARGLGIDGSLLREFGLAGLMHDIGKVRTPSEILNKPDSLTDEEFVIMRRHSVDGAEILRRTPEIPALASIVAFEHHLRLDGSGYPQAAKRPSLNLATVLTSIADVFDAMRSQRRYQQSFPTDRILAVLQRNDGTQFDQHLVRRFVQLLGIYPAGNLVRLNTGEVAVVLRVHAPDPYRPRVRLVFAADGSRFGTPIDINLWEADPDSSGPASVATPVDPAQYRIDPLELM
jgi:putative nucleotidyltransferase with HDIG domain